MGRYLRTRGLKSGSSLLHIYVWATQRGRLCRRRTVRWREGHLASNVIPPDLQPSCFDTKSAGLTKRRNGPPVALLGDLGPMRRLFRMVLFLGGWGEWVGGWGRIIYINGHYGIWRWSFRSPWIAPQGRRRLKLCKNSTHPYDGP